MLHTQTLLREHTFKVKKHQQRWIMELKGQINYYHHKTSFLENMVGLLFILLINIFHLNYNTQPYYFQDSNAK